MQRGATMQRWRNGGCAQHYRLKLLLCILLVHNSLLTELLLLEK